MTPADGYIPMNRTKPKMSNGRNIPKYTIQIIMVAQMYTLYIKANKYHISLRPIYCRDNKY